MVELVNFPKIAPSDKVDGSLKTTKTVALPLIIDGKFCDFKKLDDPVSLPHKAVSLKQIAGNPFIISVL